MTILKNTNPYPEELEEVQKKIPDQTSNLIKNTSEESSPDNPKKEPKVHGIIRGVQAQELATIVLEKVKIIPVSEREAPPAEEEIPPPPLTETVIKSSTKNISPAMPAIKLDAKTIEQELDKIKKQETSKLRQEAEKELEGYKKEVSAQIEKELSEYKKKALVKIDTEKKAMLDKAYQEGIELGKKESLKTLGEKSAEILQTVNSAIAEKNKILKKARGEILRLAIKVAEQILKSEISLNQAVCVNIVAEAISRITDKDKVIIRVNRADADYVKMNKERLLKQMGDIKNLTIQEDLRIEQGGCIIETDLGYIDATIETKLESIEKALFHVYEEEELEGPHE